MTEKVYNKGIELAYQNFALYKKYEANWQNTAEYEENERKVAYTTLINGFTLEDLRGFLAVRAAKVIQLIVDDNCAIKTN